MRIALVLESSDALISLHRDLLLEEWGESKYQIVDSISEAGRDSLFGEAPVSILPISNGDHAKRLLVELKSLRDSGELPERTSVGLIITSALNKNTTRGLSKEFQGLGKVISSSGDLTSTLIKGNLHLSKECENFLIGYVGQDYEAAIPLVRSIRKLPVEHQRRLSPETLYYRLPKPPGSIPPWEIETPLWKGDSDGVIDAYRRISAGSAPLLPVIVLSKKVKLIYQASIILEKNPRASLQELSERLGVPNNYPLKLAAAKARSLGVVKSEKMLLTLVDLEQKLKGGSAAPDDAEVELALLSLMR